MNKDRIAKTISRTILQWQTRFADSLNKKTAGYSLLKMKVIFLSACFVFVAFSVSFIADAFVSKPSIMNVKFSHIKMIKPVIEKEGPVNVLTSTTYNKLQRFKNYMDSLKESKSGRPVYDSFFIARPGLMDSIGLLEKMYVPVPSK